MEWFSPTCWYINRKTFSLRKHRLNSNFLSSFQRNWINGKSLWPDNCFLREEKEKGEDRK